MNKILSLLCALALPFAATAADLANRDSQSYDVKVHDVGTTHSSIGGNTTQMSVCSSCRIEVVGVGEIQVESGDSVVVIESGSLRKE